MLRVFKTLIRPFTNTSQTSVRKLSWKFRVSSFYFLMHLDAVKVSTCFYSGFFLIRYLTPKSSNATALDAFKSDFCEKYYDILPKRSEFVQVLRSSIDLPDEKFKN